MESFLQPIRVASGWTIEWNTFIEVDPDPEDMDAFSGSSLLHARRDHLKRAINLEWRPEEDYEGEFILRVINLQEEYLESIDKVDLTGDWEYPHHEFRTKDRLEVVTEIERLMLQLDKYVDPRIMKAPGVVDEKGEKLRYQLQEATLNDQLVERIITSGHKKLLDLLIDHKQVTRAYLEQVLDTDVPKKIRNKINQKLISKQFR